MDRELPSREAIVRVADDVGHDLSNLLAVIAGQMALLETLARLDPEARESVDEIKKAVAAAVARLHELAAIVRQASGGELLGQP